MAKGLVVILSGVSSIGKDQVRQKLLDDPELGLMDIISLTTRPKKETEKDGWDYYFVNHKDFANAVRDHRMPCVIIECWNIQNSTDIIMGLRLNMWSF